MSEYTPVPTTINIGFILDNKTGQIDDFFNISLESPKIRIAQDEHLWDIFINETHHNSISFTRQHSEIIIDINELE